MKKKASEIKMQELLKERITERGRIKRIKADPSK